MRKRYSLLAVLLLSIALSYQFKVYPLHKKISTLDYNIESGLSAMRALAMNNTSEEEVESSEFIESIVENSVKANVLLFWEQEHRDGLLYSYTDILLDLQDKDVDALDRTNLALVLLNTNDSISSITGNGVKAYSIVRGLDVYSGYKLALVALDESVNLDNLSLDNIDLDKNTVNKSGLTVHNNLAFIEQTLDSNLSRIEYNEDGNEQLVLNYTFDIIGDILSINDIRNNFNVDLVNKQSGEYFTDKFIGITHKFDNSKYLVEDKDFVECSVTLSLVLDPEYLNSLLVETDKINYKNIGYALNTFSNLFVIRVNKEFDIELR